MSLTSIAINISFDEDLPVKAHDFYDLSFLKLVANATLDKLDTRIDDGDIFAYITPWHWQKPKVLDIHVMAKAHAKALNAHARGKNYPTNILSYPADLPHAVIDEMDTLLLGELVLCHQVLLDEACAQHKDPKHHLAHLITHGILHLVGDDHELGDDDAQRMERCEIEILNRLGVGNPYQDDEY